MFVIFFFFAEKNSTFQGSFKYKHLALTDIKVWVTHILIPLCSYIIRLYFPQFIREEAMSMGIKLR